ncbi:uncharacterized protein [Primulina eburnea]|uniref:uncharacterized protein isoform X1 n=1 Tax=Primulina eburnea TaxID=1245227 RepID=UPI003C6C5DBD
MDQLVLVPSCCGFHWTLTIIEPYKEIVYLVDSLSHRIRNEDWKCVVEMALTLFNSTKERKGRKRVQWEVIKAPKQLDAKQCGYYVMRFMRQITEEVATLEGDSLRLIVILSCLSKIITSYLATYHFENSLSCVFLLIYFLCVFIVHKNGVFYGRN